MTIELGAWIGGKAVAVPASVPRIELVSPVDGSITYRMPDAGADLIDAAVRNAAEAFEAHRYASTATRLAWLEAIAKTVSANTGPIIDSIVRAIGKPRRAATFEAGRVADFLRGCTAELTTWRGELVPVDTVPLGAGHLGFAKRIPCGVVGAITPFNAPANLLVQKIGPALATGNAVVVKPHPTGIETALLVAELCKKAGLPDGLYNVVPGDRAAALALAAHPQVSVVTLTGGVAAAEALARAAGAKKFCAELGSSAANIVLADANLEDAAQKIARAGFEASGQQCISAQRIIVEATVFDAFLPAFIAAAKALKVGDPNDETVDLGPMVSLASANRVMGMMADAVARGGRCVLEPVQKDCIVSPGIAVGVPRQAQMWCDEVFGPLALVEKAASADEALAMANDSPFGLQGALFTRSLKQAMRFSEEFDVGSLWVNEASRFRLDMYPFGGVKRSGFGREGVKYAIEEMSQLKFTGMRWDA